MPHQNPPDPISRRDLFMFTSILAMLGLQEAALAGGHTAPRIELIKAQQLALEQANA